MRPLLQFSLLLNSCSSRSTLSSHRERSTHTYTHVCTHAHTYAHAYTRVHMYTRVYARTRTHTHALPGPAVNLPPHREPGQGPRAHSQTLLWGPQPGHQQQIRHVGADGGSREGLPGPGDGNLPSGREGHRHPPSPQLPKVGAWEDKMILRHRFCTHEQPHTYVPTPHPEAGRGLYKPNFRRQRPRRRPHRRPSTLAALTAWDLAASPEPPTPRSSPGTRRAGHSVGNDVLAVSRWERGNSPQPLALRGPLGMPTASPPPGH